MNQIQLYNLLDITTLDNLDNETRIEAFINDINDNYSSSKTELKPSAICVYPNLVKIAKNKIRIPNTYIACVVGGFPSGQTFPAIKMMETKMAIDEGADEIDLVINRGLLFQKEFQRLAIEVKSVKEICGFKKLKVIIESGELETKENIYLAASIALEMGADFVKTSTGKIVQGATPDAVDAICDALLYHQEKTGNKKGIKISGGISDITTANQYISILENKLGLDWIRPELVRIGASKLAKEIVTNLHV